MFDAGGMETTERAPWWRYLRLSLRSLFALILMIGGWLGWIVSSAWIQREAVAAIERDGGKVLYDWQSKNGHPLPGATPWAPRWMVDRMGVDYFGHVVSASLSTHATEEVLIHVGRLGHLRELYLMGLPVTDEGLAHLKGLADLRILDLTGARVSNDGLMSLEGLTKLEVLNFAYADRVGDAGLVHLRGLTGLRTLALYNTGVTVAGVRSLRQALPWAQIEH